MINDRAVVTEAYTVIPGEVLRDIVASRLPFWHNTRAWILARPIEGFCQSFSQYILEVGAGGGSQSPEPQATVESALFVMEGSLAVSINGSNHLLQPGFFAYLPPAANWTATNNEDEPCRFHWVRKNYEFVEGLTVPEPLVVDEHTIPPDPMPDTDGRWATTRFVDPADLRHDMHLTIVTFQPGATIPFPETHVMEHGLYILQGKGVYRLNQDWVEVEAGDYLWLRAFCPQACYAGGPGPFRYLLYKDVNRHMLL